MNKFGRQCVRVGRCCVQGAHSFLQKSALLLHNVCLLLKCLLFHNQNIVEGLAALLHLFFLARFQLGLGFNESTLADCNFGLQFWNESAQLLQLPDDALHVPQLQQHLPCL